MNKNLNNRSLVLIIILFLLIIYLCKKIVGNNENFTEKENNFKNILSNEMDQRHDSAKRDLFLKSVDKSIEKGIEEQSSLRFENAGENPELLDLFVKNLINTDENNPNKILEDGNQFELPVAVQNNFNKYNFDLRKINISKQIKQEYLIKVLKHKIDLLLNSLKSVPEIKADFERLKDPKNRDVVKILNSLNDTTIDVDVGSNQYL